MLQVNANYMPEEQNLCKNRKEKKEIKKLFFRLLLYSHF